VVRHAKQRTGECVYCGKEGPINQDHIPPKALFPKKEWPGLLKIPSCYCCNNGASKDDEYLRTMIALSAKGKSDESLKLLSEAAVRSLARPEAVNFRRAILGNLKETFVYDPAGIVVPATFGNVDLSRFDKVIARIIKGLFFKERGQRLPSNYVVENYSTEGLKKVPRAEGKRLAEQIKGVIASDPKEIVGPQFLYWSQYSESDLNLSFWVILIHRHHSFIGWTVKAGR
jgi:hypothetical protein